ncbi:MAG TPA: hypothetical protein VE988_13175 [Gemmataceae bacterium]|nr:hypothetical protein [Gemmataceae bacterium]
MRRGGASVLVLLCVSLGGCFWGEAERSASVFHRFHPPGTNLGPDGVLLDIVLIERPLGDDFLNSELWESTDSQVVGLEKQALLEENGFRVGQIVGMNPAKLQDLLVSERSLVPVRQQILPAGTLTSVPLGPNLPQCNYRIKSEGGPRDVILDQAQCAFTIVPSLTNDGRTRLKFTPQVLHGSEMPDIQVARDRTGMTLERKRPAKTYDALSWEVTLAPNQYLIVGTRFVEDASENEPQSLGNQCFLVDTGRTFTQRVLVIRTTRGSASDLNKMEGGQPVSPAAHCLY